MSEADKRILIVDDEKEITDLLEVYLTNAGYEVCKFYCGVDALREIESCPPDLAVLDIMLPDIDGFELCKRIRENYFFPVIMLTAKVADTDKINGIMLGADDYITKPFQPLELLARVTAQLRRAGQYNSQMGAGKQPDVYEIRGLEVHADSHRVFLYQEELELTPTEYDILLYMCQNTNRVVTSEELFEQIWKEKYFEGNNTVFVHISRLREKMHENRRNPAFIKTVWGVGYQLEE